MPIHDLGYRGWQGKRLPAWTHWLVIAGTGIKIALRSQWIRRTVLLSWMPAFTLAVVFFAYEQANENQVLQRAPSEEIMLRSLRNSPLQMDPDLEVLVRGLRNSDVSEGRHMDWSWLFTSFFKYSQGAMMLLLVGLIAPPLISKDVRTRAFLMYFSKPIGRLEYILGKISVPAFFVAGITIIPGMLLYVFGVLLAPDFSVVLDTWDMPLRIVAASLVTILPTCSLALMFSSLTSESRFAGFAWFAMWTLGGGAWLIIYFVLEEQARIKEMNLMHVDSNFSMLSLYHTIGKAQRWIFGLEPNFLEVLPSLGLLAGLTVFALLVLWRRVSAPIRV